MLEIIEAYRVPSIPSKFHSAFFWKLKSIYRQNYWESSVCIL